MGHDDGSVMGVGPSARVAVGVRGGVFRACADGAENGSLGATQRGGGRRGGRRRVPVLADRLFGGVSSRRDVGSRREARPRAALWPVKRVVGTGIAGVAGMNQLLHFTLAATALTIFAATAVACNCTVAACDDLVTTEADLGMTSESLEGGTVTACQNGSCTSATLIVDSGGGIACDSSFADPLSCNTGLGTGPLKIEFVPVDPSDGDIISFEVASPQGDVVFHKEGAVEYDSFAPNGALCGPVCSEATL